MLNYTYIYCYAGSLMSIYSDFLHTNALHCLHFPLLDTSRYKAVQ